MLKKIFLMIRSKFIIILSILYFIYSFNFLEFAMQNRYWQYTSFESKFEFITNLLMPFFLLLIIYFISTKKYLKIFSNIIAIFVFVFSFIYPIFLNFQDEIYPLENPNEENYQISLDFYRKMVYEPYALAHFPKQLPTYFSNYSAKISERKGFAYIRFYTTPYYIQSVIRVLKDDIEMIRPVYRICNALDLCQNVKLNSSSLVYLLKDKSSFFSGHSGFVVDEKNNEIIFFESSSSLIKMYKGSNDTIKRKNYADEIDFLTKKRYQVKHFPKIIPEDAKNYNFYLGYNPRGFNVHYLSFNVDEEYIESVLKNNKNNVATKINYSDIEKYYHHLDIVKSVEDKKPKITKEEFKQLQQEYIVYILKNENNDNNYTSGFIVSKKYKEIIFFYATYYLKKVLKNKIKK